MALDPTTVECPDGISRTFHRSKSTSLRGYVFHHGMRVYGKISRFAEGMPYHFIPDPSLANARVIVGV